MEQDEVRSNINVFDADSIPFFVCHNKKDSPTKKTLEDCIRLCDEFIYNVNKATSAEYYVGYLTKGKCFRYAINPDYKGKRDYSNLPDYTLEVREHMMANHNFISQEGYEADDLVVSYAKKYENDYNVLIVSPDKDILTIMETAYNPKMHRYHHNTSYDAFVNFWKSMIVGDTTDGVKGVPGRGDAYFRNNILTSGGILTKYVPEDVIRARVLRAYIEHYGEYEGIKEFTKNYLSLKILDNVELEGIVINKVVLSE